MSAWPWRRRMSWGAGPLISVFLSKVVPVDAYGVVPSETSRTKQKRSPLFLTRAGCCGPAASGWWWELGNGNPRMKRIRRTRAQHAARPGRGGDREIPRNTAAIASQRHTKPALLRWALHPPPPVCHQNRGFSCAQRSAIHVAYCAQASRRTFESFRCGCAIGGGCVVGASENTVR